MQTRVLRDAVLCGALFISVVPQVALAALDEHCVISILNRTVQVAPGGGWSMPNVPSNMGKVRARATCVQNGQTVSGESDYFAVTTDGIVAVGDIRFGTLDPIPVSLAFSQEGDTILGQIGATYQINLKATYANGSIRDVTGAANGTNYNSTSTAVASVSADGLVTARSSGAALITARKDEVVAIKRVVVSAGGDRDGDGLPDDYEQARGLNPADPIDALEDIDSDGLTALREYQLGSDPRKPDTDGDGLADGDEVSGKNGFVTSPLLADTDGDGLGDRIELLAGSSPIDASDRNFAGALDRITVTPGALVLTFNTINSEASSQLAVRGVLIDGSTVDLTRKSTGTTYSTSSLAVASFGATDGEVFAGQSGSATLTIANSGKQVQVPVTVESFRPVALSSLAIPGYANNVEVSGNFAFVAAGSAGLQIVDVSNRNVPAIASSLDTDGTAIDVRVLGNFAYLADGEGGLKIIDIENPRAPLLVAALDTGGIAQDIKVDGQVAYLADGARGLVIVDVTNPRVPLLKSELGGIGIAKGVDAEGARAVVVAGNSLVVVDVSSPAAPAVIGTLGIGDVKDVALRGRYAYLAVYSTGYRVVDISSPASPVIVGGDARIVPRDVELTDDFAFFAEQFFPNVIAYINVQDPPNPLFQGVMDLSSLGDYAGTGIAVDGSYAYVTEEGYVVSQDYKANGNTRLFIAQYRRLEDKAGIAPTVAIVSPAADATVLEGSTVTIEATARDDVAVRAVTFALDGQPIFTDSTQPFQVPVVVPFAKAGVKVTVTATDFGNNAATVDLTLRVLADSDRDGLANDQELLVYGTNSNDPDTDHDGLTDGVEVALGTNPLAIDTDGDGRPDKLEVDEDTDPKNPDVTPPAVAASDPASGATGAPENQPVIISFNEELRANSIRADSIQVRKAGAPVAGSVQLLAGGAQMAFMPTGIFDDYMEYEVTVAGVRDLAGNPMAAPVVFSFTTGNVQDVTPPVIALSNPARSATDVAVNAPVIVIFNEPLDPRTVTDATFTVRDSVGAVGGVGALSEDGRTLAFVPNVALAVKRVHTVSVTGVKDLFGNAITNTGLGSFTFTTGFSADTVAPKVALASVQDGQASVPTNVRLGVRFDEPISALSLNGIQLQQGVSQVPLTRVFSADHRTVTLQLGQPLQPATACRLTISGIEDLSGNVLATTRTIGFTTGSGADLVAPTVVSQSPASGLTGVPTNTLVDVKFSERLNPLLVDSSNVRVYANVPIGYAAGTGSLSADGTTVRFTPSPALVANKVYAPQIGYNAIALEDLAGNVASPISTTSFTTGVAPRTTALLVQLSSLADGAVNIPVNGRLVLQFDGQLADRCVSAQTVRLTTNGITVAATLALSTDRRRLTVTPQAALGANTIYTVMLDGLCDLVGSTLTGVTSSFTTSATATADTVAPTVTIAPASGAANVPASSAVTFTFNEAIDVTTLAPGIQVAAQGFTGEAAGQLLVNGNTVTFTPVQPFPGNTRINITVSSVRDLAGNARTASSFFTTGAATDVTVPQVVSITPNDKALDIGVNTPIVLTFSESLDRSTLNKPSFGVYVNGISVPANAVVSADNRTVILTPQLPGNSYPGLPVGSVVAVIATGAVKDLSGNALADFVSVFTTAAADTGPNVVRQFPGSGASGVERDASIVLYTTKPMNEGTLGPALHLAQNGQVVAGVVTTSADGRALVIRPQQPWAPGALIEVYLDNSAQDLDGGALSNYQGSFRIAADPLATAPSVVATSLSNSLISNPVIDLGFNQTLDPASVSGATVELLNTGTGDVVASTVSLRKADRVVRVVAQDALPYGSYSLRFSGIRDTDGQVQVGQGIYNFATAFDAAADNLAPRALAMSPPQGAVNVGVNGYVHARFDETINDLSLWPEQPQRVYESLFWSDSNQVVEFMRHDPYPVNSAITESVAAAEDLAGNGVSTPNSVTFTTGSAPDFARPNLIDANPFQGATNVPVNRAIRLRFDEPLDPLSVNASTCYVSTFQNGPVAALGLLEADGLTISFVPTVALAVSRGYQAFARVQDLSGNATGSSVNFTTGATADTQSPVVAATAIADGQANVPTNALLWVTFDESLNEQTLGGIGLTVNGSPATVTRSLSSDRRTVTLKQLLQGSANYMLTVSGVEDVSGNVLAAARTISFSTAPGADLVRPVVVANAPTIGATGVSLNPLIEVTYDEPLNPLTVNTASVRLITVGNPTAGTVSLSADGRTVRYTPAAALLPNRAYTLTTNNNDAPVQDLAGNSACTCGYGFTTGGQ